MLIIYLNYLLDGVVEDENGENDLASHHKVVKSGHVSQKFHRSNHISWNHATSGWHLKHQSDLTEQVNVGIVDGEVDEDGSGGSVDPQVVPQVVDNVGRVRLS